MKKYLVLCLLLISMVFVAYADSGDDGPDEKKKKADDKTKKEIERQQEKWRKGNKVGKGPGEEEKIGEEALKPVTEVDPEKLVEEIMKRMEKSEKDMLSAGVDRKVGGLQEDIIQGLNRLQGDIVRDLNKLVDVAKMIKENKDKKQKEKQKNKDQKKQQQKKKKKDKQQSMKRKEQEKKEKSEKEKKDQKDEDQKNPKDPAEKPYDPNASAEDKALRRERAKAERWGDMPAKERNEIKHTLSEGQIPKYEKWIEEYMKQLGEKP